MSKKLGQYFTKNEILLEKLFEFQNLYFEDELEKKDIKEIIVIQNLSNEFQMKKLNINE